MIRRTKQKRHEPAKAKIIFAAISLINIALTIVLKVMNRQETLKALKGEDEMRVIAVAKKETQLK